MEISFDQKALEALYLMEKTHDSLFLTGKAGTGKSTLLRAFLDHTEKNVAVLAPTGVAALNIGGSTIHSFFKIPPTVTEKTVRKEAKWKIGDPMYTELDAIIIDEISMVRADLFDCINLYMQIVCENKLPFGGKQMILIGDLYQLPPVVASAEREFFAHEYPSPYFFASKVIRKGLLPLTFHELEKVYRQKDQGFLDILNGIRTKKIKDGMLETLNKQVVVEGKWELAPGEMYLAGRNITVDKINEEKLEGLPGKVKAFKANVNGAIKSSSFPTDEKLRLKVGAQVMFVVNDSNGRWVNGTLGVVKKFVKAREKYKILIQIFDGDEVEVVPYSRRVSQYVYNPDKRKLESEVIGGFTQMPLRLAWACTIHKSQGKTFEKVLIDLKGGSFAHGQTYVALSRCKSLEGIQLITPLQMKDILLDWNIVRFVEGCQRQKLKEAFGDGDIRELLKTAIKEKKDIEIVYMKDLGIQQRRILTPKKVGKMEFQGHTFDGLKAFCHGSKDERVFNVEKIMDVREIE